MVGFVFVFFFPSNLIRKSALKNRKYAFGFSQAQEDLSSVKLRKTQSKALTYLQKLAEKNVYF